nr:uncharacterized protein LOC119173504 isoform X3 [Rhipicephalus microplus]
MESHSAFQKCHLQRKYTGCLPSRYVKHPRLEELDKEALVQLYEKTVLPLPQRKYRDTRSGRALSALRKHADSRSKRKASRDFSSDSTTTKLRAGNRSHNDGKGPQRPSEPPHTKSGRQSSGGEWGSWDEESKSTKRSITNRCLGEGPPRKKHRTPITWP